VGRAPIVIEAINISCSGTTLIETLKKAGVLNNQKPPSFGAVFVPAPPIGGRRGRED